jgi:hypothetical protein
VLWPTLATNHARINRRKLLSVLSFVNGGECSSKKKKKKVPPRHIHFLPTLYFSFSFSFCFLPFLSFSLFCCHWPKLLVLLPVRLRDLTPNCFYTLIEPVFPRAAERTLYKLIQTPCCNPRLCGESKDGTSAAVCLSVTLCLSFSLSLSLSSLAVNRR